MNVEEGVFFEVTGERVAEVLTEELQRRGYKRAEKMPLSAPSRVPATFEEKNRRFFFVSEFARGPVIVVENGGLFDEELVKGVTDSLKCRGEWIALHESINAWGRAEYAGGELTGKALHPPEAFRGDAKIEDVDYTGDATEEAFAAAEKSGLAEAFLSYEQVAKGAARDASLASSTHLAFVRE